MMGHTPSLVCMWGMLHLRNMPWSHLQALQRTVGVLVLFISNSTCYMIIVSFLIEASRPHVLHDCVRRTFVLITQTSRRKWEILDSLQTHDMDISSATHEPGWNLLTYLTILLTSPEACWCRYCSRNNSIKQQLVCCGVCWVEVIWQIVVHVLVFSDFNLIIFGLLDFFYYFFCARCSAYEYFHCTLRASRKKEKKHQFERI